MCLMQEKFEMMKDIGSRWKNIFVIMRKYCSAIAYALLAWENCILVTAMPARQGKKR